MTDILFPGKARLAHLMFRRTGSPVEIHRADGNATENKYGKISDVDQTYSKVADEYAKRMYGSYGERSREGSVEGGRVSEENARVAMMRDTEAQVDDHVIFPDGSEYALDARVPRETHYEFKTTLVTN